MSITTLIFSISFVSTAFAMLPPPPFQSHSHCRYYSASILKIAGFSSSSEAIWLSVAVAFCNFVGSMAGLYLVDRVGRRRLTLVSLFCVCVCLFGIAVAFYLAQHESALVVVADGGACGSSVRYCFDCIQVQPVTL